MLAADLSQIILVVALLVAAALVVALVARALVSRKARPPQLPAEKPKEELRVPEVAAPVERVAREGRARDELETAEQALHAARETLAGEPGSAAARAEVARYEREVADARRKLDYEARKTTEATEKARKLAEAAAQEEAAARARAEEAARAEEQRRAAEEARRKLVEEEKGRTLAEGLAKTRGGFIARLNALVGAGKDFDDAALGELEEILFSADVGVRTAMALLESVRERLKRKELGDLSRVKAALRVEIERILSLGQEHHTLAGHGGLPDLPPGSPPPQVVMVVGVNGTGKTTTVGKLAALVKRSGKSVLLGAGDTFRAAAGEQLDIWADRAEVPIVRGKDGSDPGAVLFDAVAKAKSEKIDVVLCDTAGRLHTRSNLMDELTRFKRTLAKTQPGAPHEVLLVVDATTGQNAIQQARQFHEALGVTGFVLTKLDGTAKGGVIIGICDELKIPVRYVGVGEKVADLKPFDAHEFVEALFGEGV
ncbi:MAG: signal recognition particle-docking protein FtsY [Deltaproteobacteria bacterium]|nr:MAG: signal recognition particle-docking protein FtsY [Deltaproteobacteria bacterium]